MATRKGQTTAPVSIRLSVEERRRLESAAGKRTLSDYIRERLFGDQSPRRQMRNPKLDARLLAQLLGRFGQAELASSMRDLSQSVRTGALPVTAETEKALRDACVEVAEIRADLMRALGLVERGPE